VSWSAGGWVSAHASARARLAFLALLVGPSTSVEAQQLGSTAALAHRLRLAPQDSADAVRFVTVTVGPGDRASRYAELRRLLDRGRSAGWVRQILEADDIPESEAGTDSLWARRNAYDPAPDLRRFRGPILAVYGGADDVVPAGENAALLRRIATDAGNARVRALVVPLAGHGLEQPAAMRTVDLGTGTPFAYWKSRRAAPQFLDALVGFLREHGLTGDAR
jgi:pimeloyl-ACP methyl ester carboxylesterase